MSNQGNIEVRPCWGEDIFRFTTSRWGGDMTPPVVQRALKGCYTDNPRSWNRDSNWDPHEFLGVLMHDPDVRFPIAGFGNTDTPTVVVDFAAETVTCRREWGQDDPEMEKKYGSVNMRTWSFKDFSELSFRDRFFGEWYENLYYMAEHGQDFTNHACGRCGCYLSGR